MRNGCWFLLFLAVKVEPLANYLTSVEQSPTTTDDVDESLTWLLKLPLVSDGAAVPKASSSFLLDPNIFFFFPTLNQMQKLQLLLWLCDKETARFTLFELIRLINGSTVKDRHFAVSLPVPFARRHQCYASSTLE